MTFWWQLLQEIFPSNDSNRIHRKCSPKYSSDDLAKNYVKIQRTDFVILKMFALKLKHNRWLWSFTYCGWCPFSAWRLSDFLIVIFFCSHSGWKQRHNSPQSTSRVYIGTMQKHSTIFKYQIFYKLLVQQRID